jgi:hypothetical protein
MSIVTFDLVGAIHGREYTERGEYVAADDYRAAISALIAITNSGPDAIPIKEAFEMAHRAIERAMGGDV